MLTPVQAAYALVEGLPHGAWVAISMQSGSVLSFGDDVESVVQQARDMGEPAPLVMKVPDYPMLPFA